MEKMYLQDHINLTNTIDIASAIQTMFPDVPYVNAFTSNLIEGIIVKKLRFVTDVDPDGMYIGINYNDDGYWVVSGRYLDSTKYHALDMIAWGMIMNMEIIIIDTPNIPSLTSAQIVGLILWDMFYQGVKAVASKSEWY